MWDVLHSLCLNISLVTYADDIFSISQTSDKISESFQKLQAEYLKSSLELDAANSDVMLFNWKGLLPHETVVGNLKICPSHQIVYPGIPIGNIIFHTRQSLTEVTKRCLSASYASIDSTKRHFNSSYLATLYNSVALLQILYISPSGKILTNVD